jgi:hypothetical protein
LTQGFTGLSEKHICSIQRAVAYCQGLPKLNVFFHHALQGSIHRCPTFKQIARHRSKLLFILALLESFSVHGHSKLSFR